MLDNLIHRGEVAEMVVAFVPPGNRLVEYANHAPHARFVARELVPYLTDTSRSSDIPGGAHPDGVELRRRRVGVDRGPLPRPVRLAVPGVRRPWSSPTSARTTAAGRSSIPVVKFVNGFRARPQRIVERIYMTCGMYEPLITPNRSMVSTFREAGMEVRYVEARDGHNWENWRDRLRDGLTWLHPGDQKFVYE